MPDCAGSDVGATAGVPLSLCVSLGGVGVEEGDELEVDGAERILGELR